MSSNETRSTKATTSKIKSQERNAKGNARAQVLLLPPYKIFDTLAVPLYPAPVHRKVSLRLILTSKGAVPCDAGPLQRQWQLLRRTMAVARLVRRRPAPRDSLAEASLSQQPQQMVQP